MTGSLHLPTKNCNQVIPSSSPNCCAYSSFTKKRLDWTLLLAVDTTKLDQCTSLPHSNQGANNDHVSGGRPQTTNKVTGSGNFHCHDRLRRLKGILPFLRGTVDLAGQLGRHFKDIQLKSGNWDDFDSCLVFVDEKLEGVGGGKSPKIKFLSTS